MADFVTEFEMNPDTWVDHFKTSIDWIQNYPEELRSKREGFFNLVVPMVYEAYTKQVGSMDDSVTGDDMKLLFEDKAATFTLFHLTYCIHHMMNVSKELKAIIDSTSVACRASLPTRRAFLSTSGASGLCSSCILENMLHNTVMTQTEELCNLETFLLEAEEKLLQNEGNLLTEEGTNTSRRIYCILILLNQILESYTVPEVVEILRTLPNADMEKEMAATKLCKRCKKDQFAPVNPKVLEAVERAEDDTKYSDLCDRHYKSFQKKVETGLVKRCFLTPTSLNWLCLAETRLSNLGRSIMRMEAILTVENVGKERIQQLSEELKVALEGSVIYLSSANDAMYTAFRKLIVVIDPGEKGSVWFPDHQKWWGLT